MIDGLYDWAFWLLLVLGGLMGIALVAASLAAIKVNSWCRKNGGSDL
jgi:hypothetical protein